MHRPLERFVIGASLLAIPMLSSGVLAANTASTPVAKNECTVSTPVRERDTYFSTPVSDIPYALSTPRASFYDPWTAPLLRASDLPTGPAVSEAVLAGMEGTIRELAICNDPPTLDRRGALFTENWYRRTSMLINPPTPALYMHPVASIEQGFDLGSDGQVARISRTWMLSDGRALAILGTPESGSFVVVFAFDQSSRRWLIDEEAILVDESTPVS